MENEHSMKYSVSDVLKVACWCLFVSYFVFILIKSIARGKIIFNQGKNVKWKKQPFIFTLWVIAHAAFIAVFIAATYYMIVSTL